MKKLHFNLSISDNSGGILNRKVFADHHSSESQNYRITESQNHRMFEVGRHLCGSSSPTLLPKQGHLQQAAQFSAIRSWIWWFSVHIK